MFAFAGKTARDARIDPALPVQGFALVKVAETWVYKSPDASSARLTQFTLGETLTVHRKQDNFLFVQSQLDCYCGWVNGNSLFLVDELPAPLPYVTRHVAPITRDADMKSPLLTYLPPDARFDISCHAGDYAKLESGGWAHQAHIQPAATRRDPVVTAREQLDRSYVWGGRGVAGLDCSSLVQFCHRFAGHALPRDADLQRLFMAQQHRRVSLDEAQPGDLVFLPGHVMLASGHGKIIHASGHHMLVIEEAMAEAMQRYKASLGETFFCESYHCNG